MQLAILSDNKSAAPPLLSRNLLQSGDFPERTIGNLGGFSDFVLLIRAELLQPPYISSPPMLMVANLISSNLHRMLLLGFGR